MYFTKLYNIGDRVQIIGTYRCLPGKKSGHTTGIFRTSIIANNVRHLQKDQTPSFFENDIPMIKKFGRSKDPFRNGGNNNGFL